MEQIPMSRNDTELTPLKALLAIACLLMITACAGAGDEPATAPAVDARDLNDPYLWLEEVEGEDALKTARTWNARSLERLQTDPRFAEMENSALTILNADDKIPYGFHLGDYFYNTWRDETNVRGLLRRTPLESFLSEAPVWETLLDIDQLAAIEYANWVYKGSTCLEPSFTRCLVSLSDGGKDARERREWDHETKSFVEGGFFIPEAKSRVAWKDADTLLVATDWGLDEEGGSLTESGYPYILKAVRRGEPLSQAQELFRGTASDVTVAAGTITTDAGDIVPIAYRQVTYYTSEYHRLRDDGDPVRIPLPNKSTIRAYFKGELLVSLEQNWTPFGSATYPAGALVSFDFDGWLENPNVIHVKPVYIPNSRSTLRGVSRTKSKLLVTVYQNVIGKVFAYDFDGERWSYEELGFPDNGSISVISANRYSNTAFIKQDSFIAPDTLFAADLSVMRLRVAKSTPPPL